MEVERPAKKGTIVHVLEIKAAAIVHVHPGLELKGWVSEAHLVKRGLATHTNRLLEDRKCRKVQDGFIGAVPAAPVRPPRGYRARCTERVDV